jgi:hypothetical protein
VVRKSVVGLSGLHRHVGTVLVISLAMAETDAAYQAFFIKSPVMLSPAWLSASTQ